MEKIVKVYQELKNELKKKEEEVSFFEKATLTKLKTSGWVTKDEIDFFYKDKRNIKLWVEEIKEVGNHLKFKLVCVGGDERFKGAVVRYSLQKSNKEMLTSRYKPSQIFDVHLLKLKNDKRKPNLIEECEIGSVVLYKKPTEFHSKMLCLKKPGRRTN